MSVTRAGCDGFVGNNDLYGLGIRIGIYLQWISSLLTNVLVPSGISDSLDANTIFLFALFVAIANATNSSGAQTILGSIGAFVMLQMCFGYLLSVMSVTGLRITLLNNPHGIDPNFYPIDFRRVFTSGTSPPKVAELKEMFKSVGTCILALINASGLSFESQDMSRG